MGISVILRKLLEERNLTQKQLALELGIPASTLGGYVQGTSEPDLETVKILAAHFGCTVDYLLGLKSKNTLSLAEDELLHLFRNMTVKQQSLFLELGKTVLQQKE